MGGPLGFSFILVSPNRAGAPGCVPRDVLTPTSYQTLSSYDKRTRTIPTYGKELPTRNGASDRWSGRKLSEKLQQRFTEGILQGWIAKHTPPPAYRSPPILSPHELAQLFVIVDEPETADTASPELEALVEHDLIQCVTSPGEPTALRVTPLGAEVLARLSRTGLCSARTGKRT